MLRVMLLCSAVFVVFFTAISASQKKVFKFDNSDNEVLKNESPFDQSSKRFADDMLELKRLSRKSSKLLQKVLLLLKNENPNHGSDGAGAVAKCNSSFPMHYAHTGSCYHFSNQRVTWFEARAQCQMLGSDLVAIESSMEQHRLEEYVKDNSAFKHCDFWTSGSDTFREEDWQWLSTGESVQFNNFHPGEPNNSGGSENCLLMDWFFSWRWNDADCSKNNACYICEQDYGGTDKD